MSGKKNSNRVIFLVAVILIIVGLAAYLLTKNKTNKTPSEQANVNTANTSDNTNVFEKPGESAQNYTPVAQTKTTAQLEAAAQSQGSTPADYNSLAMAYYKSGDKDKALQVISEGLAKFPNNNSLLLTKDDIENVLPNL